MDAVFRREGETSSTGEYEQPNLPNFQQPVLYPPSYFKTAVKQSVSGAETCTLQDEYERTAAAAASPASTFIVHQDGSKPRHQKTSVAEEKELTALRIQNEALRSQLQALHYAPSASALPPLHHHCTPGALTSDLLQVECGLQSRLARSESEVRRLASQLAVLENTLREERDCHSRDRDTLICQHRAAMDQVMGDKCEAEERWKREGSEWRERVERAEEREGERTEELNRAEEKLAQLALENSGLVGELEQQKKAHREEVASLHTQLDTAEEQIGSIQSELQTVRSRVEQLEPYLGGELPEEGSGVTWREERTALLEKISVCDKDRERMENETQLMAVRLTAISEILSLQDARLMQGRDGDVLVGRAEGGVLGEGGREEERGESGGLKSVLSLWREKVFVLLVQSRLQQMQHTAESKEAQCRVCALQSEASQASQERDLLSHTLTDRTAQLQLQIRQTEEVEGRLREAEHVRAASEAAVDSLRLQLRLTATSVCEAGGRCARFKSCMDGCLSRLANYEQRMGVATGRVAALRAMLTSQLLLQGGGSGCEAEALEKCDNTTQTEPPEKPQQLSQLSQDELMEEVISLMRERDTLSDQLSQSTASLRQLRTTALAQQQTVNETCSSLQADNSSLSEQLAAATEELEEHRQRQAQLKSTQASLQARIDSAVMEERRKGRHELNDAQSLLELARREQSKTALQLQLAERKLQSESASAVEAVEVAKRGVEEELRRCRERLRAVQVERNILLTTLRQEGIKIPPRRPQPMPAHQMTSSPHKSPPTLPHTSHTSPATHTQSQRNTLCSLGSETSDRTSHSPSPPPSPSMESTAGSVEGTDQLSRAVDEETCGSQCFEVDNNLITTGASVPPPHFTHDRQTATESNEEDISDVLKELQLLSTSLLDMRTVT